MKQEKKSENTESGRTVLNEMLRITIDFPQTKILSLVDEYEEFLDSNDLIDPREERRQEN